MFAHSQLDRPDLALQSAADAAALDDDAAIASLALAWASLRAGGDHVGEAVAVFQDLTSRWGTSHALANGLAAAHMALGEADQAMRVLQEAQSACGASAETLVNMVAAARHLHMPQSRVEDLLQTLRQIAPKHPWLEEQDRGVAALERVCSHHA